MERKERRRQKQEEKIKSVFAIFNVSGTGRISRQELAAQLKLVNSKVSDADVRDHISTRMAG